MVSILMKGIWDREFMASRSVSGRKCPTDKSGLPPKPALPNDPVKAIKRKYTQLIITWIVYTINNILLFSDFCSKFWKERHNTNIKHVAISHSISAKLLKVRLHEHWFPYYFLIFSCKTLFFVNQWSCKRTLRKHSAVIKP